MNRHPPTLGWRGYCVQALGWCALVCLLRIGLLLSLFRSRTRARLRRTGAASTGFQSGLMLIGCLLLAGHAHAHKSSDSYLEVEAQGGGQFALRWDIALRDLDYALGLDSNQDGQISWREVRSRFAEIDAYTTARLTLADEDGSCALEPWQHRIDQHSDGTYLVTDLRVHCAPGIRQLAVRYQLFFDLDATHRGLLNLHTIEGTQTAVLGPEQLNRQFSLTTPTLLSGIGEYFVHGVAHIWSGIDHILFLVSLLLPSVLVLREGRWEGRGDVRATLLDIARVVTAFTAAHSITLSAAVLGWVSLPSRMVESVIAASVVLAALNNLRPWVRDGRWMVAFVFGLIHGFGFAAVLTDLDLPRVALSGALLGFNLGVEAGQLAIVLLFIPLAWPMRTTRGYRLGILGAGSAGVALLASVWLVERVFELSILPFKV